MLYRSIFDLIGNTPLLEIPKSIHGFPKVNIFAKLEYYNPFGSIKDRTAYALIKDHINEIKDNQKVILESSSGNTAKALASFASILNTKLKTISGRIRVEEQYKILRFLGAHIDEVPEKGECPDPSDPENVLTLIEQELDKHKEHYFYTDQYNNIANINYHYATTGQEIWNDLDGKVDYLFAGVGTAGSSRGPGTFLKERNPETKVIAIVADSEDFIPGIRTATELLEVGLFKKDFYDSFEEVSSNLALDTMRDLILKTGIYAGPTGGASYAGLLQYLKAHYDTMREGGIVGVFGCVCFEGANLVFIVCDRFEPYTAYINERKPDFFGRQEKKTCLLAISKEQENLAPSITTNELSNAQDIDLLIDTRNNLAFKNLHIPGSLNIEFDILVDMLDDQRMPFPKDQKIVLICPIGKKTKRLTALLQFKGYNAQFLLGGLQARIEEERPVAHL